MHEFSIIEEIFLPLSNGEIGAFEFKDDAAFIDNTKFKNGIVITTDTLVENTHFLSTDSAYSIGQKLLRVNLSDLIAKGCKPIYGFLNIAWPKSRKIDEIKNFAMGIKDDINSLGLELAIMGGDTTSTDGNLVISLTLMGTPYGEMVKRENAKLGQSIYVTGYIGDAMLGLEAIKNNLNFEIAKSHYQVPKIPNPLFAQIISKYALASMDISDGLWGDVKKLLPNDLNVKIELDKIPISNDVEKWLETQENYQEALKKCISFGDDYQCIFTIENSYEKSFQNDCDTLPHMVTKIGEIVALNDGGLFFKGEKITPPKYSSYIHSFKR